MSFSWKRRFTRSSSAGVTSTCFDGTRFTTAASSNSL
jgi:hypothetical protein